jgi:FkbM family methyltransferase
MFYSQFGEDQWLEENVLLPVNGTYVDVGAGDPVRLSNTAFLEDKGWEGLCIDADPRNYANLLEKRRHCFFGAVGPGDGFTNFYMNPQMADISGLTFNPGSRELLMAVFTLDTILNAFGYRHIDLLSIDVEGHELDVLRHYDFGRRPPTIIICEYNTSGVKNLSECIAFFADKNYELLHTTEANVIVKRRR